MTCLIELNTIYILISLEYSIVANLRTSWYSYGGHFTFGLDDSWWTNRCDWYLLVGISVGFVSLGKHLCSECWVDPLLCFDVIVFTHDKGKTIPWSIFIMRVLFNLGTQASENRPWRSAPLLSYHTLFSPFSFFHISFFLSISFSPALFICAHHHIILPYSGSGS